MVAGDPGMESVFEWSTSVMNVERRGATEPSLFQADGVHVLTGPIYVEDAEEGDVVAVEILDLKPRPNQDGKTYGSNAAAWWGFQARNDKADGTPYYPGGFMGNGSDPTLPNDETVSIYELDPSGEYATLNYMFKWPFLTDPKGVFRNYYAFPGTCVPHDYEGFSSKVTDMGWTKDETRGIECAPYA